MPEQSTKFSREQEQKNFLANHIVRLLQTHQKGNTVNQLQDDLRNVVEAVNEHGKAGKLKIEISVEPQGEDDETVSVAVKANVVLPRPSAPKLTYFKTNDNGLSRHHPNQLDLFED